MLRVQAFLSGAWALHNISLASKMSKQSLIWRCPRAGLGRNIAGLYLFVDTAVCREALRLERSLISYQVEQRSMQRMPWPSKNTGALKYQPDLACEPARCSTPPMMANWMSSIAVEATSWM